MRAFADPDLFDTPPEEDFDRLTRLAATMIDVPVAMFSMVDADRQFFKSAYGLPEPWASRRGTPLSHSFCQHVVASGRPLSVDDARRHPLVADNFAIHDLGVVAYLGEPVRLPSGTVVGSFCAIDDRPRVWTARDREIVSGLARGVEQAIRLRAAAAAQAETMRGLIAKNEALQDLTAELASARAIAERALGRQTRLLAGLSHELRTPLNGVIGGVTLLGSAADDAARARFAEMIRASARALQECVDDLITYCRLGAGIEETEPAPFDPHRTAAEAAGAIEALAAAKGLSVDVRVDPATPRLWVNDGRRVEQLLVNLLGNAVKYTADGFVGVSVALWGEALAFRVHDTGAGVPESRRETIFEPFDRGDPAVAKLATGTGLGLAIARETAARLGGSLTLERSAPGEGSTFLLLVPDANSDAGRLSA